LRSQRDERQACKSPTMPEKAHLHLRFADHITTYGVKKARPVAELWPSGRRSIGRQTCGALYPASKPERRTRIFIRPLQAHNVVTICETEE
jgi:hypothetical protein